MTGWECPRCHRAYSPFVQVCSACAIQPTFTTVSTGDVLCRCNGLATTAGMCSECGGLACICTCITARKP
jgi:hypothetical protein